MRTSHLHKEGAATQKGHVGCTRGFHVWVCVSFHQRIGKNPFDTGHSAALISVLKLYKVKALNESKGIPYESVNLSIFSVSEVLAGTLTASLPPLRRLFENLPNKVLPESLVASKGRTHMDSYVLPD